jgi:hypothetical protein
MVSTAARRQYDNFITMCYWKTAMAATAYVLQCLHAWREAYIRPPRNSRVLAGDASVAAPLLCALLAAVLVRAGDVAATEYRGQNHHQHQQQYQSRPARDLRALLSCSGRGACVKRARVFVALTLRAVRMNRLCLACQPGKSPFTLLRWLTFAIPCQWTERWRRCCA